MENTWAVELRIPGTGEWVVLKADMTQFEASKYIIDRSVTGGQYRKRKLEGPAYNG